MLLTCRYITSPVFDNNKKKNVKVKLPLCLIKCHSPEIYETDENTSTFITLALDGGVLSAIHARCLTSGKQAPNAK
jgi:hypothetical protein